MTHVSKIPKALLRRLQENARRRVLTNPDGSVTFQSSQLASKPTMTTTWRGRMITVRVWDVLYTMSDHHRKWPLTEEYVAYPISDRDHRPNGMARISKGTHVSKVRYAVERFRDMLTTERPEEVLPATLERNAITHAQASEIRKIFREELRNLFRGLAEA